LICIAGIGTKGTKKLLEMAHYELVLREFSDLLCACLVDQKQLQSSKKLFSAIALQQGIGKLERIRNDQGSIARAPSESQRKKRRRTASETVIFQW
jgi:hypothetical protein